MEGPFPEGTRQLERNAAQQLASSEGGRNVDDGCAHCHVGNWIHVRYEYPSEQAVTNAAYVVQKPNGGQPGGEVITEGVLTVTEQSAHQFIHVDLGDYNGEVEVFFFDDPTEPAPVPEPAPVEDERAWYEQAADAVIAAAAAVADGAEWVGEIAMGDFNDDMSTSQIVTNAIVTAIPGVDQVADVRDLVANGKYLIWDKRYNEIGVWVGVFACLIGLIPSLGSLAKGVIKLVWRNAGDVGKILIYINKALAKVGRPPNGYRFLKKLADEIVGHAAFVTQKFNEFLDVMVEKITLAQRLAPRKVAEALAVIEQLRAMANERFVQAATEIRARILAGLLNYGTRAYRVLPSQSIIVRRATQLIVEMGPFPNWERHMGRPGFDKSAMEAGARQIDETGRAKMRAVRQSAGRWKSEILKDLHAHAARTDLSKLERDAVNDLIAAANHPRFVGTLETFDSKPTYRIFQPGDRLYRVIGDEGSIGGRFWSPNKPPSTEAEWRSRDAVLNDWNNGGAYVVAEVPPPPAAFEGEIGPQDLGQVGKDGMMLDGGGTQTFMIESVPSGSVREYWYTEWNAPTSALQAARNTARWKECDL